MAQTRILVVEDEIIVVMELQERLESLGYAVAAVAASGEEAIQKAAEMQPDLVLMDIRLQGEMSGIEAAEAVQAQFDIPVVYLTAFSDENTLQQAKATEPFGYLLKPFQARQLYSTIEMALCKHRYETMLQESAQRLRLYSDRLRTLREIDQAILSAYSPETIAQAVVDRVRQLVPCVWASVVTFDTEPNVVTVLAIYSDRETVLKQGECLPLETYGDPETLREGRVHLVVDTRTLHERPQSAEAPQIEGIHSYIQVPLVVEGTVIGALDLGAEETGAFGRESVRIVREVANSLAVAIHQARLREQVEHYVIALRSHVDELQQAEEALRQRTTELEARNAELDAFAHTVAHDLRNPLSAIINSIAVLNLEIDKAQDEKSQRSLQVIAQDAWRMNNIVGELLLLSEVRKVDREAEPLDMAYIVAAAQNRLAYMIEQYQAEIVTPDTWPMSQGYGPWVEEVWVNYLSNALRYGGRPPRVELGATEPLSRIQRHGALLDSRQWLRHSTGGPGPIVHTVFAARSGQHPGTWTRIVHRAANCGKA